MEFDIDTWLNMLLGQLKETFGDRLIFVGCNGSFARGEATKKSDIDVNIILDSLSIQDLRLYRRIIKAMPTNEKACGFICSIGEIKAWPTHELFQFTQGCKILHGSLEGLIKPPTDKDIQDNIRNTASAIFHETCHRFIFGEAEAVEVESLELAYKTSFFVLQEWFYLKEHRYIPTKKALVNHLEAENRNVLVISIKWDDLQADRKDRPEYYFALLKNWSSTMLKSTTE
jgi:hypothetical protein